MNAMCKVFHCQPFARAYTTFTSQNLFVERLNERSLIRLKGEDVHPFLQGLITNDISHLNRSPAIYTLFLNRQGRILYDATIYKKKDDTLFIECDKDLSSDLRRHLRVFRMRRNIDIDCMQRQYSTWVVFNPNRNFRVEVCPTNLNYIKNAKDIFYYEDPRLKDLGMRIIMPKSTDASALKELFPRFSLDQTTCVADYKYHRVGLGVGEGPTDHLPGKAFPLESNADFLHGISFQKGCYLGQELTARTYHTGLIRKRLLPLNITKAPDDIENKVVNFGGTVVGTLRTVVGSRALGLMRVDNIMKTPDILIEGEPGNVYIPEWWPRVLPKRISMKE